MKPCPECKSENISKYKKAIPSYGVGGPMMLPEGGILDAPGTIIPVVCMDCGFIRYFASNESLVRLKKKKSWVAI
ncbi:MAG: hypothetical protein R3F50_08090 [Gammaproteobacteria bacterium]